MNVVYTIYTLTNPITMKVYYVGVTGRGLQYRLYAHQVAFRKNTRMKIPPIIEPVDTADDKATALRLEAYWIQQFKAWGFSLNNKMHYGADNYPYQKYRGSSYGTMWFGDAAALSDLIDTPAKLRRVHKDTGISTETIQNVVWNHTTHKIIIQRLTEYLNKRLKYRHHA